MAYVDSYRSRNRPAVVAVVAVLHLAAGYALITGLAASFIPEVANRLAGYQLPIDPPKPHAPQPSTKAADPLDSTVTVTRTPLVLPAPGPTFTPGPVATTPADGDGIDMVTYPSPTPTFSPPVPRFTPRVAAPLGDPARWVSPDDYPPGELRREHEGVTRFRLSIGTDGRVTNCAIIGSSGWPALDAAACAKLSARATFRPAIDENGDKVSGSYTNGVLWNIPDE